MKTKGPFYQRTFFVIIDRNMLYIGLILLLTGMAAFIFRNPAVWTQVPSAALISGKRVVIDPGHGGFDPGAKSPGGVLEKNINLDVALRLKKYLSQVGVNCIMVRETDRDYADYRGTVSGTMKQRDLAYRIHLANQCGANLFLSIHANSFPQTYYRGAQTFFNPENPVSRKLAFCLQRQLVTRLGPNQRKIRPGDFRVLKETKMPGAIVEIGFLSNPGETALLADPDYREKLAQAIYCGILDYFTMD